MKTLVLFTWNMNRQNPYYVNKKEQFLVHLPFRVSMVIPYNTKKMAKFFNVYKTCTKNEIAFGYHEPQKYKDADIIGTVRKTTECLRIDSTCVSGCKRVEQTRGHAQKRKRWRKYFRKTLL